jgi:hypothetical protein
VLAAALIEPATARAAIGDADRRSRTAPGST